MENISILDYQSRNLMSYNLKKKKILKILKPAEPSTYYTGSQNILRHPQSQTCIFFSSFLRKLLSTTVLPKQEVNQKI